jgi:4-amino-4-deoxy-L-arabinose transferase-like glycosyltransferase
VRSLPRRGARTLLVLLVLSGTLCFFRLGTPGLFDADEPAYAQAAREMLESGDWITPHFNGQPRFDKPILFYWLTTLTYRVFGVTEFAVRFWSALAAVILVLVIARAARRWFGPPADLLAGLAVMTNLLTALLARAAVTDMLLTLFVTLAILAGVEALSDSPERGRRWAMMGWGAMGLAVLVKGPVGLVIPGMALGGALLVLRELRRGLIRLFPWQGVALFAALAFPWYVLVLAANGWAFVQGFVIKHHVTRYTGVISSHAGPLWFYLPVVLVGFFPWSGFLPRAIWQAAVARRREAREPADRLLVACACWAIGVFVFFSFAGTKLPSYLFPAFPAMALLVAGCGISNGKPIRLWRNSRSTTENGQLSVVSGQFCIAREGQPPRWLARAEEWLIGVTGAALALGFAAVPWILDALRPRTGGLLDGVAAPVGMAWWLAGLVAVGTAAGLVAKGIRRAAILAAAMSLLIFTAEGAVAPWVYGVVQEPLREFAQDARQILGGQGTLVLYGLNAPSIVFYANHPVTSLGPGSPDGVQQIRQLLEAGRPLVIITRIMHLSRLDAVPGLFRLKASRGYAIYCSPGLAEGKPRLATDYGPLTTDH